METGDLFLIAAVVLLPAAILWAIFVARSGGMGARKPSLGIPQAMRPAPSDEKLEGRRLERLQTWGLVATLATAVFIPAYWLPETDRQEHFAERFEEEAVHRGKLTFSAPPLLEDDVGAQEFKELEEGIALGQNCAFCHGAEGQGGPVPSGFVPPGTTKRVEYQAPPLNNVFTRWDEEMVRFTIERGRPGTPMPPWGVEFGGPMTTQMVDDVIAWLHTLPENNEPPAELAADASGKEIFEARCAVCHGPEGQGKEDATLWYQGMALWKGDVKHLTRIQHYQTIQGARRWGFMPAFSEVPPIGVPAPPYPLTEEQIQAVIDYERSL